MILSTLSSFSTIVVSLPSSTSIIGSSFTVSTSLVVAKSPNISSSIPLLLSLESLSGTAVLLSVPGGVEPVLLINFVGETPVSPTSKKAPHSSVSSSLFFFCLDSLYFTWVKLAWCSIGSSTMPTSIAPLWAWTSPKVSLPNVPKVSSGVLVSATTVLSPPFPASKKSPQSSSCSVALIVKEIWTFRVRPTNVSASGKNATWGRVPATVQWRDRQN